MDNKNKIELAELVLRFINERAEPEDTPTLIGTLKEPNGLNGFKPTYEGYPVFEYKGRYILYLESLDGKNVVTVPFNKDSLKPKINFQKEL